MHHTTPFARRRAAAGLLLAAAAVLPGLAGCERSPGDPVGGELIRSETFTRDADRILAAQASVGAAADGMLYDRHFARGELNSLGRDKLSLMLDDPAFAADPQVYVVSGDARQMASARRYLSESGRASETARINAGINPAGRRPAASGLQQQAAMDNSSDRGRDAAGDTTAGR